MKFFTGLLILAAAPQLLAADFMEVTGSRVNIRNAPSIKGKVIGSVKARDRVSVRRIKDGWAELDDRPGFLSVNYLRKVNAVQRPAAVPGTNKKSAPAPKKTVRPQNPTAKLPAGQVFADLPVVPESKRDVTVRGMLFPMKAKGHVRYALLKVVGGDYVIQCYIYVPDKDAGKYKEFANTDVQLVGYWYKVSGWKRPVMQVRRIKGL